MNLTPIEYSIIQLTSALYDSKCMDSISKEQLRDALSSGQLISKKWLLDELNKVHITGKGIVVGGWVGLLACAIEHMTDISIDSLDIDPQSIRIAHSTLGKSSGVAILADMYDFDYTNYDFVINTSTEHIPDIQQWLSGIKKGTTVCLQSNNAFMIDSHINCVNDIEEFLSKVQLTEILYSGEYVFPMYTRYMIIGVA